MSTDVKSSWAATRLPCLSAWCADFRSPILAREAPYAGTLPALILATLIFLTLSGFVLSLHYVPGNGFGSLQYIDRSVNNGWLVHGFHETGATMIFALVFLALFRGLYARGYKAGGDFVWLMTVKQFVLLLVIGWLGYTLSDGAVAYWSLSDATDAATRLPGLAGAIGTWFFGGPDGPDTLGRMTVFHVALALSLFLVVAAHRAGAKALRRLDPARGVAFHPYYTAQYLAAFAAFALIFSVLLFFAPHIGENPLNAAPGGPLIVPVSLTPPWYLAPLAAASSVFGGTGPSIVGIIAMLALLFLLPWLDRGAAETSPGWLQKLLTILLALDVIGLGLSSLCGPGAAAHVLSIVFTIWYFLHFLVFTPLVTSLEAK